MNLDPFLRNWGNNPKPLLVLAGVGVILLVLAAFLAKSRRRKTALIATGKGLLIAAFVAVVVVRHPHGVRQLFARWFGGDVDNLARVGTLTSATAAGDDWPQRRGPNRDGVGLAPGLRTDWNAKPPEVVWKVSCGEGYSSPIVVGGRLYLQDKVDDTERVRCLDAASGKDVWTYEEPVVYRGFASHTRGPRATPAVVDGRVYAVGATGRFLCLEANPEGATGKLLWQRDLLAEFDATLPQWGVAGSPLVEGDLVVVQPGGSKGAVAAFDRATGERKWAAGDETGGYSSPVAATIAGTRQIVAFTGSSVLGLALDGRVLWRFGWDTSYQANIATPVVAGDHVFVSSGYNAGCAFLRIESEGDGLKAEPIFVRRNKLMRNHHSTGVLHDGHLYAFDVGRGDLKCVALATGKEVWTSTRIGKGTLVRAGEHLIVQTEMGDLALVDATPGEFKFVGKVSGVLTGSECWATPALVGGRMYVRDHRNVVCLKID